MRLYANDEVLGSESLGATKLGPSLGATRGDEEKCLSQVAKIIVKCTWVDAVWRVAVVAQFGGNVVFEVSPH